MAASTSHFSALGRALVQQGRLVQADANAIQAEAAKAGLTFIQQLIQSKKISAKEVSLFAAQTFGYPLLDFNAVDQRIAAGLRREEIGRAHVCTPVTH